MLILKKNNFNFFKDFKNFHSKEKIISLICFKINNIFEWQMIFFCNSIFYR
jgi:hypothetical protein